MIPHRTLTVRTRDVIQSFFREGNPSLLQHYIPKKHHYWTSHARTGIEWSIPKKARVALPAFTCHVVSDAVKKAQATPVYLDNSIIFERESLEPIAHTVDHLLLPYNFGFPSNVRDIVRLCRRHSITLIEDCAMALGATYNHELLGSYGNTSIFSFNMSKNCGYSGAVIATDEELQLPTLPPPSAKEERKRMVEGIWSTFFFHPWVYNFTQSAFRKRIHEKEVLSEVSEFSKRVIYHELARYEKTKKIRRDNAKYCIQELYGIMDFQMPLANSSPTWAQFILFTKKRHEVMNSMRLSGVEISPFLTFKDTSCGLPLATQTENTHLAFDLLRKRSDVEKFVKAVKIAASKL